MFPKEFIFQIHKLQESICSETNQAVMVTDINSDNQNTSHYCLILDPEYLLFAQRDPIGKQVLQFNYASATLTKNDRMVPLRELPDLISKVYRVFADIQEKKARMYSKPAGGFKPVGSVPFRPDSGAVPLEQRLSYRHRELERGVVR